MTNQEAAEMIRNDMKLHHDSLSGKYRKALSMAISALQAQDLQPNLQQICKLATDCISRQDAIDAIADYLSKTTYTSAISHLNTGALILARVPSAQPERLTDDDFETIRIHLNAYKEKLCNQQRWEEAEEYQRIIDRFTAFASAQPDIDEWCTDCKEYDQERHCCPRWNRVIRQTLKDAQPNIIHCGECKYHHDSDGCFFSTATTGADGFCHWAERKEGEADEDD